MIDAIEYARTNNVPLLGICLGMQLITIEYARNVCGIKDANSLEFDELCKNPVINLMSDQSLEDMGGTQRLGVRMSIKFRYTCSASLWKRNDKEMTSS